MVRRGRRAGASGRGAHWSVGVMPLVSAYRSSSSPAPATPPSSSGSIDHSPGPPQPQQTRPRLLPRRPCVPADPRQQVAVGCPLPRAAAAPLPAAACPKPPMATQQEVHGRMLRGQTDEVHARHGCPTDHSREGRAVLFMRDQNSPFFCFFFPGGEGCRAPDSNKQHHHHPDQHQGSLFLSGKLDGFSALRISIMWRSCIPST